MFWWRFFKRCAEVKWAIKTLAGGTVHDGYPPIRHSPQYDAELQLVGHSA